MNFNALLLTASQLEDMPAPLGFDTWLTFWMVIAVCVTNTILMIFAGYKFLQVIQLSSYKIKGYFSWIKDTKGSWWGRLIILSFLSSAALLITNVLLYDFFRYKIMPYFGLIFYLIFCIIYIVNQYSTPQKTPLKYTNRMTRMVVVYGILIFAVSFTLMMVSVLHIKYFQYGVIGLTPMFVPILVLIAYYITYPFEKLNNRRFVKRAKQKLQTRPDLIKIGITGSYAKTSVKNILAAMLAQKYVVCSSPMSYNTPLGISKTILETLTPNDQVLIAEMGAKYVGDIKELCDIVNPSIGVLTGIANQHKLTFGSEQNIINTKSELSQHIASVNGQMFFNADDTICQKLANEFAGNKIASTGLNKNPEIYAKDFVYNNMGISFTLVYKDKEYKTQTSLLGKHNVSNIILCANICLSLGLTIDQILNAITKLTPSPHRLAIVPSSNALIIIDDAYNGNVEGAKAALDVLASYGTTKVVITPGLIELGDEQFESNKQLGSLIAKVADYVIVNGTSNFEALNQGLIEGNMKEDRILRSGSLKQAVDILNRITEPGDVVLFENDLPDNYN